jgi:hypothetical protein
MAALSYHNGTVRNRASARDGLGDSFGRYAGDSGSFEVPGDL